MLSQLEIATQRGNQDTTFSVYILKNDQWANDRSLKCGIYLTTLCIKKQPRDYSEDGTEHLMTQLIQQEAFGGIPCLTDTFNFYVTSL